MPLLTRLLQLLGVVGIGTGLFCLGGQIRELLRARSSLRWPTGTAVVISAAVRERRGRRRRIWFQPAIEYRYSFAGRDYTGHRIAFGETASFRRRVDAERDLAARLPLGARCDVSICERRPELAVLTPGPTANIWFGIVFFCVSTLFSVAYLLGTLGWFRGY